MTTRHLRRRFAGAALALGLTAGLTTPLVGPASAESPPAPACGAGATPNAKWVQYVYGKILNRCAEPSAEAHWAGLVTSGKAKRVEVSRRIDLSYENLSLNNVIPIYEETVGRTPNAVEITHWVKEIRLGQEDARLSSLLMASQEFYVNQEFPDPCGFQEEGEALRKQTAAVTVELNQEEIWVYNAFCSTYDREPSPEELTDSLAAIGAPSSTPAKRFAFLYALKRSPENAGSWVGGVYGYGLERGPSDAEIGVGIPYLINVLKWRTFELFTRVLASDEAFAKAQQPPAPLLRRGLPIG